MISANPQARLLTAEEFYDVAGSLGRSELTEGVVIEMGPTCGDHGESELDVGAELRAFVRARGLGKVYAGEVGFILSRNPDTVRGAEVCYLSTEKAARVPRRGFSPFAPDLAVEVVSPDDRWTELRRKVDEWLAAGTVMVWVVDPARRTVEVYSADGHQSLAGDALISGGTVLPEFEVPISRFFGEAT